MEEEERRNRFLQARQLFDHHGEISCKLAAVPTEEKTMSADKLTLADLSLEQTVEANGKLKDLKLASPPPLPSRPPPPLPKRHEQRPKGSSKRGPLGNSTTALRHLCSLQAYKRPPLVSTINCQEAYPATNGSHSHQKDARHIGMEGMRCATQGNLVVLTGLHSVRCLEVLKGETLWSRQFNYELDSVSSILIVDEESIWAGTSHGTIVSLSLRTGEFLEKRVGVHGNKPVVKLCMLANGIVTSADHTGLVLVWNLSSLLPSQTLKIPNGFQTLEIVEGMGGTILLLASNGKSMQLYSWQLGTDNQLRMVGKLDPVACGIPKIGSIVQSFVIALPEKTTDIQIVTAHEDGKLVGWTIEGNLAKLISCAVLGPYRIKNVLLTKDKHLWVFLSTGRINVISTNGSCDPESWRYEAEWLGHNAAIEFAVNTERLVITVAEDWIVALWDVLLVEARTCIINNVNLLY